MWHFSLFLVGRDCVLVHMSHVKFYILTGWSFKSMHRVKRICSTTWSRIQGDVWSDPSWNPLLPEHHSETDGASFALYKSTQYVSSGWCHEIGGIGILSFPNGGQTMSALLSIPQFHEADPKISARNQSHMFKLNNSAESKTTCSYTNFEMVCWLFHFQKAKTEHCMHHPRVRNWYKLVMLTSRQGLLVHQHHQAGYPGAYWMTEMIFIWQQPVYNEDTRKLMNEPCRYMILIRQRSGVMGCVALSVYA